jgi:hypothetical protein
MLENMFPRHVLEFIVGAAAPNASLGELAYQHEDVSMMTIITINIVHGDELQPHIRAPNLYSLKAIRIPEVHGMTPNSLHPSSPLSLWIRMFPSIRLCLDRKSGSRR